MGLRQRLSGKEFGKINTREGYSEFDKIGDIKKDDVRGYQILLCWTRCGRFKAVGSMSR